MLPKIDLICFTLLILFNCHCLANNQQIISRKKRQLFGLAGGTNNPASADQILNTCMGWMLGSFLDGISSPKLPPNSNNHLINHDATAAPSLAQIHQMDIPITEITEQTLQKLNPEERRILENLQLLQNKLKYKQYPHVPELGRSLDQQLSRTSRGLGRPLTHQSLIQPNEFLANQWRKVESDERNHYNPPLLRAHSTNPWERSLTSLLPDQKVSDISNPWQLHAKQGPPRSGSRNHHSGIMNIFGPIMDKPKNRVIIDTGKNFDRFLVHEAQAQDALGLPFMNNWKTMGAMWDDGDIHLVNSDGKGLLGTNLASKSRGFSIPFKSLLKSIDPINKSKIGKKAK